MGVPTISTCRSGTLCLKRNKAVVAYGSVSLRCSKKLEGKVNVKATIPIPLVIGGHWQLDSYIKWLWWIIWDLFHQISTIE